jgi:putative transposase
VAAAYSFSKQEDDFIDSAKLLAMIGGDWKSFLLKPVDPNTVKALRKHERTGRPLGDSSFIEEVEKITGR